MAGAQFIIYSQQRTKTYSVRSPRNKYDQFYEL